MTEKYRDRDNGSLVEAYQVPRGCTDEVVDHHGDLITAYADDWVIYHPYTDVVDPESFDTDYERVET